MTPVIETLDGLEGARAARGLAVVIDVFRAFTVACFATARGARRIHPVAALEQALALKRAHPDWLLAGDRHGKPLPGFDFGNSPTEIEAAELAGRTLVHTTSAGTQGLCAARGAAEVITGSLVNAGAICRYVAGRRPARVSLVCMGREAREPSAEDTLCAALLEARLAGAPFDESSLRERLRAAPAARMFFDPAADWAPEGDFERCTHLDRFDFVLRLEATQGALPGLAAISV